MRIAACFGMTCKLQHDLQAKSDLESNHFLVFKRAYILRRTDLRNRGAFGRAHRLADSARIVNDHGNKPWLYGLPNFRMDKIDTVG